MISFFQMNGKVLMNNLKAVRDYVLVDLEYKEKEGRIFVPDQAKQMSGSFWGKVIDVGPDCPFKDEIKKGDKIVYLRNEGYRVHDGDRECLAVKSRWIYGVMVE